MKTIEPLLGAALSIAVAACSSTSPPIALQTLTAPNPVCLDVVTAGVLVADNLTGLGIANNGKVMHVTWPEGWTTRIDGSRVALVDSHGAVLAHVGDSVSLGGGSFGGPWLLCENDVPPIVVIPSPTIGPAT